MNTILLLAADAAAKATEVAAETAEQGWSLRQLFIDGNPYFMSTVAFCLALGLAFCIERIVYLSLSEINAKKHNKTAAVL